METRRGKAVISIEECDQLKKVEKMFQDGNEECFSQRDSWTHALYVVTPTEGTKILMQKIKDQQAYIAILSAQQPAQPTKWYQFWKVSNIALMWIGIISMSLTSVIAHDGQLVWIHVAHWLIDLLFILAVGARLEKPIKK